MATPIPSLAIQILPEVYAVCQLPPGTPPLEFPEGSGFHALIRTPDEWTVICQETLSPPGAQIEKGWKALKVVGPLDFSMVGILADLSGRLAEAGVSLFAVSTFDTDYILVRSEALATARSALLAAGHRIGPGSA